jgi:hypothetical protein
MSSSDARMFDALAERVAALEEKLGNLAAQVGVLSDQVATLAEAVLGKDVGAELYGAAAPDHAADREARAALLAKRRDRAT